MTLSVSSPQIYKDLLSKTGNSIYNDEIRRFLAERIPQWFAESQKYSEMVCIPEFISEMKAWIQSSETCQLKGIDSFEFSAASLGVTQSLDEFHYEILSSGRTLRLFRGEYPYNRDVHPFDFSKDFIDDRPLEKGDALILSCPFSGTGNIHPRMDEILDTCEALSVPVFLDMAWFGTCGNLTLDLSHPAITHVAFSLTKGLTCGNYRSGIRLSRQINVSRRQQDRLQLQNEWNHAVHLNHRIGLELMKNFSPDTQFRKYRKAQLAVCEALDLSPSLCVHIATGTGELWKDFDRDGASQRINLREAIKKHLSREPQ